MATLKSLVDETTNIKNEIIECRDTLKQILIDKKIEGLENENKLSKLISFVRDLNTLDGKVYLYKDGYEFNSITGGFNAKFSYYLGSGVNNCTFAKNSDNFGFKFRGVSNQESNLVAYSSNKIDLTKYKKICATAMVSNKGSISTASILVTDYVPDKVGTGSKAILNNKFGEPYNVIQTIEADISSITGSHYIGIGGYASGTTACTLDLNVYSLWLE